MNEDIEFWKSIVQPVSQGGLLGAKFVWGGRGPNEFDCWGLVIEIYRRMGIELLDQWQDQVENHLEISKIYEAYSKSPLWLKNDSLLIGSVIALSTHFKIHHIGVLTPWGVMHTTKGIGAIIQDEIALKRSRYKILGSYTYNG